MKILLLFAFASTILATINTASAQKVLLESTIVRCAQDDMLEDGTPKHPLELASSFKSHPKLDLKFYSKCRKKLHITLRVTESKADFVPNALILINQANNVLTKKTSRLGTPIAVKFHQEMLLQRYKLKYMYRVNGKMYEEVINTENSKNYTGCFNSPDQSGPPTCGYVSGSDPKQIAGFCCSCQEHKNNVQQRGGQRCDIPHKTPEQLTSAHCLRSSPYSYNVYEILPPTVYQTITFEVFKSYENRTGSLFWERMSENGNGVQVDSDTPTKIAGAMKVTYHPHVEGVSRSVMHFDPSIHRLLLPFPNPYFAEVPDPEPLLGAIEEQILIVPKTLMSPHGAMCDRAGTKIDAFVNQHDPCRQERNTCLQNQPFDLWKQDQGAHGDPKSRFRLKSYQKNLVPLVDFEEDYKNGAIYMEHTPDAPSYVDIEIPADDLAILSPGYNAFIEYVFTDTGTEGAKIIIQVLNKELVEAAFSIELVQCSLNFLQGDDMNAEMKSPRKKIGPLNGKYFDLDIHSDAIKLTTYCYVVLVNEHGESIAAREVTLKPYETCLCVHTCKCACGDKTNLQCEKMSDENIVAAGLIHTIKTAEQLKEAEKHTFTEKYKWVFHWILAFHIVLLALAICGWLQKRYKKRIEKTGFPIRYSDYEEEEPSSSRSSSSDSSEITLYNKNSFPSKPVEEVPVNHLYNATQKWTDSSKPYLRTGTTPSKTEEEASNNKLPTDTSGIINKVTFASQPQIKSFSLHAGYSRPPAVPVPQAAGSSVDKLKVSSQHQINSAHRSQSVEAGNATHSTEGSKTPGSGKVNLESSLPSESKVNRSGSQSQENTKAHSSSNQSLPHTLSTERSHSAEHSTEGSHGTLNRQGSTSVPIVSSNHDLTHGPETTHASTHTNKKQSAHLPPEGKSESGTSNLSLLKQSPSGDDQKDKKTPSHHQGGPQEVESNNSWTHNNDNMENFYNYLASASSSKTSFGTWHRKKRDQYSAYDFLPAPKHNSSFS